MAGGLLNRRSVVKAAGIGAMAALGGSLPQIRAEEAAKAKDRGRIKQSVCRWCYKDVPLEQLCAEAKRIGYKSIELVTPAEFPTVKEAGLTCAMLSGACEIGNCLNRKENHEKVLKALREHIEFAAANSLPSVICFSGNRKGMSDEDWVDWGALDDDAWYERVKTDFGLDARPWSRTAEMPAISPK